MASGTSLRALVVADDPGTAELLRLGLRYERFRVETCADAPAVVRAAERFRPDVVVLDWQLPGLDGPATCRRLRAVGDPAVVALTTPDALEDPLTATAALDAGAADFVVKPVAFAEVAARLRAALRRRAADPEAPLRFADLVLDPATHEVARRGRPVRLTPREFALLRHFMEAPRRVFSKRDLLERVWGYGPAGDAGGDNLVELYVGYLRRKLGDRPAPRLLQTVRGVGYALRDARAA
jgi:DNA-binding response OmpR family regulator